MASAPLNWLLKIGGDALHTTAQTLSAAVNELKDVISSLTAVDIGYDSVNQGGIINNVQTAIDDVYFKIEELDGAHVAYDNTASGLAAVKVQGAIDEVNSNAGVLADLSTTAKSNLVAAINEVKTNAVTNASAISALATSVSNDKVITNFEVDTNNWVADSTSQSGKTLYKKSISLQHIYGNISVDIGSAVGNVLPTAAEQIDYDLITYATADNDIPCLYLYAEEIPSNTFYINVEGAD